MKTDEEFTQEEKAAIYKNGALAIDGVLANPDIHKTVISVWQGDDGDVRLTLSRKSENRVQIVAYRAPDDPRTNEYIDHDDHVWAEWDCRDSTAPVARIHQEITYDENGNKLTDWGFSEFFPASAEKILEMVAQAAVEKRRAREAEEKLNNKAEAEREAQL